MDNPVSFLLNSLLLGVGLAMDAFSVSLANGLNEPDMKKRRAFFIAFTFAFFQALMPLIGWTGIKLASDSFAEVHKFVPWTALIILAFIGTKMIVEAIKGEDGENKTQSKFGVGVLLIQGIATSIDALSAGFAFTDSSSSEALGAAAIISAVTFVICVFGVAIGKKAGTGLSKKAGVLGGVILIAIGMEIFIKGVFF